MWLGLHLYIEDVRVILKPVLDLSNIGRKSDAGKTVGVEMACGLKRAVGILNEVFGTRNRCSIRIEVLEFNPVTGALLNLLARE